MPADLHGRLPALILDERRFSCERREVMTAYASAGDACRLIVGRVDVSDGEQRWFQLEIREFDPTQDTPMVAGSRGYSASHTAPVSSRCPIT
jgi:hypothetical protein